MPTGGEDTGLTDKQLQFCRHYARTFNAGESYQKAGYATSTSGSRDVMAYRLLRNPKVSAYLSHLIDIDETKIVAAVSAIALCPITEIVQWDGKELIVQQSDQWSERAKLAVKKVTTKQSFDPRSGALIGVTTSVEMHDRLSALDKLMRMLSMFPNGQMSISTGAEVAPEGEKGESAQHVNSSPAAQFFRSITGVDLNPAAVSEAMDSRSV